MQRNNRKKLTEREIARRMNKLGENPSKKIISADKSNKFKDTGIKIVNDRKKIIIEIPKSNINALNSFDLANHIKMLVSPLFLRVDDNLKKNKYESKNIAANKLPHVAIFMNNVGHYSGGRYYAVMFYKLLASIGCKVTVVTDMMPFFIEDFNLIDDGNNIDYITDIDRSIWCMKEENNNFDLIISVPNIAGVHGFNYAKKWNLPVYMMVFETPNYVSKYRGGLDSGEGYWLEYKRCLAQCDKIICLAEVPMKEAINWLEIYNVPKERFIYIYPAINTYIADVVEDCEEKHEITFIGRHTDFKNPFHVVEAVGRLKCKKPVINFVGTHSQDTRIRIQNIARRCNVDMRFYANINDIDKYKIIKRSKIICIPTSFEGFGIPPAEAFYCKKPVIAYDIPVIKGVYGDIIDYADIGDIGELACRIENLLEDEKYRENRAVDGYKKVVSICHPNIVKREINKKILNRKDLKISVGMIVLNAANTIKYSLKSIYDSVQEILIVEGAVEDYIKSNPNMVNFHGSSIDNTLDIINNFPDPENKIKLLSSGISYKHKMEMQNIIAENITGDIYLKVDADELYHGYDIERIRCEFEDDPDLWVFKYKFNHFWHNLEQIAVGGQWESKMTRCWRWRKDFRHSEGHPTGFNFYFDKDDNKVDEPIYKVKEIEERLVYHLNYALQDKSKILAKIKYYRDRGIENNVRDTWSNWKQGDRTSPTHQGGTVMKFEGRLPKVLQEFKVSNNKDVEEKLDRNTTLMYSPIKNDIIVVNKRENINWTIGMIVLNENKFVRKNILNLLGWKDLRNIIIVEGADYKYPRRFVTNKGLSKDGTSETLEELSASFYSRIEYVKYGFANDKQELRNQYLNRAKGTHLIVIDADEFYTIEDLNLLTKEVSGSSAIQWEFERDNINEKRYGNIIHFWHSIEHRVVGGYYSIPHQRIYKIEKGMMYNTSHNHPTYPNGKRCDEMRDRWSKTSIKCYHAGFLKDRNDMRDKQNYYYNRGERITRSTYSKSRELWFNWDGTTMEYPEDGVKILKYDGKVPVSLRSCLDV